MAGNEELFQQAMQQGHSEAWDQRWERAAEYYRRALQEFPVNPKALASLGLALYELGQYDKALGYYLQNSQVAPDDPVPLVKAAQIYERLGNIKEAAKAAMKAAGLYLQARDTDKAIENWTRVTRLYPNHLQARSHLGQIHERLGRKQQAVTEYLAMAAILQNMGDSDKTIQLLQHAQSLLPDAAEVRQAINIVKSKRPLPLPERKHGATGPLRMAKVRQMEDSPEQAVKEDGPDPIAEARQKALTVLADLLFEQQSSDKEEAKTRHALSALMQGTGRLDVKKIERTQLFLHLGQTIDLQTRGEDAQAAVELEKAISAGMDRIAAYFLLGLLHTNLGRLESAQRHLRKAIKHKDFGLATRLMLGQIAGQQDNWGDAAVHYLEALKLADVQMVPAEQADALRQLYEPLIETQSQEKNEKSQKQLAQNIKDLLIRPSWRLHLKKARQQFSGQGENQMIVPLAEMLTESHSSQLVEHMGNVMRFARSGLFETAMEEAYYALQFAPNYLPLHTYMGEILLKQERVDDAMTKFASVARAYDVREDAVQATETLRRMVQLSPMDLNAHLQLIDILAKRGLVDEALSEYVNLADSYYRLAELDTARNTYRDALRMAQQSNADRAWSVQILHHMADIDMQRLAWRKALLLYDQIRTLQPSDELACTSLIEVNFRLGDSKKAVSELDTYVEHLRRAGNHDQIVALLQQMIEENPNQPELLRRLIQQYQLMGKQKEAIQTLDSLGDMLLEKRDQQGAIQAIQTIIQLAPPNVEDYRTLLAKIQNQ